MQQDPTANLRNPDAMNSPPGWLSVFSMTQLGAAVEYSLNEDKGAVHIAIVNNIYTTDVNTLDGHHWFLVAWVVEDEAP